MIVDCHTHINCGTENIEDLKHLSAAETVDGCIVLACGDGPSEQINQKVSDYVRAHGGKMAGFGVVDPTKDGIDGRSLSALKDKLGLKGIVLYCSAGGFHPAHSRAMQLYEAAEGLEIPVFFHNNHVAGCKSVLRYAEPFLIDEVAGEFGSLKIIIGSMGRPFVEQTLDVIANHENVYADLTIRPGNIWEVYNIVVGAYENGVMDKLLFGSGFPASNAGACIEVLLGFNKLIGEMDLPTVPRDKIRGVIERNTLEVLGIS